MILYTPRYTKILTPTDMLIPREFQTPGQMGLKPWVCVCPQAGAHLQHHHTLVDNVNENF